jgi:hypothetical protein
MVSLTIKAKEQWYQNLTSALLNKDQMGKNIKKNTFQIKLPTKEEMDKELIKYYFLY